MNWFAITIVVLACARITHLLADDYILSAPREWYEDKTAKWHHLNYLVTCTWCMSIYVAGALMLAFHDNLGIHGWLAWLAWPSLSYTTVMLEALVEYLYGEDDD